MKRSFGLILLLIPALSLGQMGMARQGQYDEEARQAEREEKATKKLEKKERKNPLKQIAGGVKQTTVDNTTDLISETAESTRDEAPVIGTIEGARKSSEKILDNTVKGVAKVATLGYGEVDHYEIQQPEHGTDDTTKIKIKL